MRGSLKMIQMSEAITYLLIKINLTPQLFLENNNSRTLVTFT